MNGKGKKTILIADDNKDDALLLHCAFHRVDPAYHVVALPDGQQFIDYLEGSNLYANRNLHPLPTLVLLDLNMPGVAGLKALRWVRRQPQFDFLPIVAMSGSLDESLMERALASGASAYLIKPVAFAQLVQTIEQRFEGWLHHGHPVERLAA